VCRVLIPPQQEEGGGIQNAGMRAPVGRSLVSHGFSVVRLLVVVSGLRDFLKLWIFSPSCLLFSP
jgi:hypothetical protein